MTETKTGIINQWGHYADFTLYKEHGKWRFKLTAKDASELAQVIFEPKQLDELKAAIDSLVSRYECIKSADLRYAMYGCAAEEGVSPTPCSPADNGVCVRCGRSTR